MLLPGMHHADFIKEQPFNAGPCDTPCGWFMGGAAADGMALSENLK